MQKYDPKKVEKKWQQQWEEGRVFEVSEDPPQEKKFYALIEFPYPSGAGLHVGHPRPFTAMDVISRKRRMEGYNVLYPIGFDAFGLPTENYAIKTGRPPAEVTAENIATFTRQLKALGFSFDWSRAVDTTDPKYYRWTQWIFLQFFKHGLAYKKNQPINWCPSCKIGLANEEVVNGACERCGYAPVEKRNKEQWMLAITKYADKLLAGLKEVDYIPQARVQQENWIGRSEGAVVRFSVIPAPAGIQSGMIVEVFTTRPDTLFGATYMVLAPEHELVKRLKSRILNAAEVGAYLEQVNKKTEQERTAEGREKTGVELKGIKAINPVNNEAIPVWIADYVLASYGTGAIMAVPAHDQRDWEFASKYHLPIKQVVAAHFIEPVHPPQPGKKTKRRQTVHAIVRRKSDGKILMLQWKGAMWEGREPRTFIIGGTEAGEDPVVSAEREIKEETGYRNLRFVKDLGLEVHTEYHAAHKDENRYAEIRVLHFELNSDEQDTVSAAEMEKHTPVWIEPEEVGNFINVVDGPFIWNWFNHGGQAYTPDGISINSDFLTGLSTPEAKAKMIAWLEEQGIGKRQVNYKLRDWVFSRQRYWGEPIPLVYCENCAQRKPKILYIHGIYGYSEENWIPWFRKEMKKRGYEVLAPNLPNNVHPSLDKWLKTLADLPIGKDESLIVVGHSLGGPAACQFVLKHSAQIERLILISPTGDRQEAINWKNLRDAGCDEESIECIKKFNAANQSLDKVRNLAKETIIYLSEDDPFVPLSVTDNYSPLRAKVKIFKNKGHFNERAGILELPEILDEFPDVQSFNSGWIPLPEDKLPLELPKVAKYQPTDTGESPLAAMTEWVKTTCPRCGGPARRETDTMPNWAGSSWYFLRYCDPHNNKEFASMKKLEYWMGRNTVIPNEREESLSQSPNGQRSFPLAPARGQDDSTGGGVDWYNGGMEHTVLHLLYSRFWNQFLYDLGLVPTREPYKKRTSHGLILGPDGEKMSKSRGNVVNPDEMVEQYGADALRMYIMFMGPFDQPVAWDTNGVKGVKRFLEKVWAIQNNNKFDREGEDGWIFDDQLKLVHKLIRKITTDIDEMKFNTAIAKMMEFINEISSNSVISRGVWKIFLKLLSPFAPHIADELWNSEPFFENNGSLASEKWPIVDEKNLYEERMTIVIQVNGKVRARQQVGTNLDEEIIKRNALSDDRVQKWLEGKAPKKIIYVKGRLVSIVV